jgi:hypothetical protein
MKRFSQQQFEEIVIRWANGGGRAGELFSKLDKSYSAAEIVVALKDMGATDEEANAAIGETLATSPEARPALCQPHGYKVNS